LVSALIDSGFDLSIQEGWTNYHIDAIKGNHNDISLALGFGSIGSLINAQASKDNLTPLMLASIMGHTQVIEILLTAGGKTSMIESTNGRNSLMLASLAGK
jgi:ankyrin repeat protein